MGELVYALCALTSILCAVLLLRGYRASGSPLLFWSSLCFVGLAFNNIALFVDLVLLPDADLALWRRVPALIAIVLMLIGLVFESEGKTRR